MTLGIDLEQHPAAQRNGSATGLFFGSEPIVAWQALGEWSMQIPCLLIPPSGELNEPGWLTPVGLFCWEGPRTTQGALPDSSHVLRRFPPRTKSYRQ